MRSYVIDCSKNDKNEKKNRVPVVSTLKIFMTRILGKLMNHSLPIIFTETIYYGLYFMFPKKNLLRSYVSKIIY